MVKELNKDKKHKGSVEYICEWCGEPFLGSPSRRKAKHICCSKECMSNLIRKITKEKHLPNATCPVCGENFWIKPSHLKRYKNVCCSKECSLQLRHIKMSGEGNHQYGLKGKLNPTWKSDEKINFYGYKMVRVIDHPFKNSDGFVLEHRLIAEKYLLNEQNSIIIDNKRYLRPDLEVHHIDLNKSNNSPENLLVLTKAEHKRLHCKISPQDRDPKTGRFIPNEKTQEEQAMLNLKIHLLSDTAQLPTKSHETDACYDIYSNIPNRNIIINPHEAVLIPSGFSTEIPHGYWGAIFSRSGLATKQGLRIAQGVAVIDESYRGEWMIPIYNDSDKIQTIHHNERICQFMLLPYYNIHFVEVETLDTTERGTGGFGSTGV